MTEVAIDCGYPASAKNGSMFCRSGPASHRGAESLIYTATAGHQGTLGGLIDVTRRFSRVLSSALERLRLCSGDPVCADHDTGAANEDGCCMAQLVMVAL
jgi:hypothetical protein